VTAIKANNSASPIFQHAPLDASMELRINKYYDSRQVGTQIMNLNATGQASISLVSNDYLSLSRHPDIVDAMLTSLNQGGCGTLMSGVFVHGNCPQTALQQRLAGVMQAQAGLLCQSGYAANVGLLQSIANSQTNIHIDMMAHMSLWEGIRSAGAHAIPFIHNDSASLEKNIRKYGGGIVVVDSIYSTTGAVAPLRACVDICEKHGCTLLVDESHSLGIYGPQGAGLVAELGLSHRVQFRTASLAKAFAGRAGFIACSERFSEYLRFESLPAIFSSTLLPHDIAGLDATLTVIQKEEERRTRLQENSKIIRDGLTALGYNLNGCQSQIIALESGPEDRTLLLHRVLTQKGLLGAPFIAPATPKNRSLIRLSLHAALTDADLHHILNTCEEIRSEVDMPNWPSTKRLQRNFTATPCSKTESSQPMSA
jgi:CAI-1 autoinducer synthase